MFNSNDFANMVTGIFVVTFIAGAVTGLLLRALLVWLF